MKHILRSSLIAFFVLVLASCSKGGGDAGVFRGAGGVAGQNLAALGPLMNAEVVVSLLNNPETVIADGSTDENGFFTLNYAAGSEQFDDRFVLVEVEGGWDTDAMDDGVRDAAPTQNNGSLRMLAKLRDLKTKSIAVSVLSDAIYRSLESALDSLPEEGLEAQLEELAYSLMKDDVSGDGMIGYDDIMSFNPTRAEDKAMLDFDYAGVLEKRDTNGDGTPDKSLVDLYHDNNVEGLSEMVDDVFQGKLVNRLPDMEQISKQFTSITVNSGNGGFVTSPDIEDLDIGSGNNQFVIEREKGNGDNAPLRLIATPDDGFKFVRWVGCINVGEKVDVSGDPNNPTVVNTPAVSGVQADGSCQIDPDTSGNLIVSAQFAVNANDLSDDVAMEMTLTAVPGKFGVTLNGNELILTANDEDIASRAKIDSLMVNALVHTGVFKRPQVKVTAVGTRGLISNSNFYQGRFTVADTTIADMYDSYSAQSPDTPVLMDDLNSVKYEDINPTLQAGETEQSVNAMALTMPTRVGKGYVEGPTPSGKIDEQGSCPKATDEEIFTTAMDANGNPVIACIEEGAEPLADGAACAAGETTLGIIDGRRFCIPAGGQMADSREGRLYHAAFNKSLPQLVKTAAPKPGQFHYQSPGVQKLRAEGRVTRQKMASEVFLDGYGRAFDLGNGVFLTNAPDGSGLLMLETNGKHKEHKSEKAKAKVRKTTCTLNATASGCAGYFVKTQTLKELKPMPGDIWPRPLEFPLEFAKGDRAVRTLSVTIIAQLNVQTRNSSSFTYVKPVRFEFNTSGSIKVTPTVGVKLAASLGTAFEKNGTARQGKDRPLGAELKKKLLTYDFAKNTGQVWFQGEVQLIAGAELKGEIAVQADVSIPLGVRYDGAAAVGWGCRNVGKNIVRVLTFRKPKCGDNSQRIELKVVPSVAVTLKIAGSANAVIEPFLEVAVVSGIRGLGENLSKIALRAFVQGEALIEGPTVVITTDPIQKIRQEGKAVCVDGIGAVSFNAYYGLRAYAQITSANSALARVSNKFSFSKTFQIAEYKVKFASYGWELKKENGKLKFPAKENVGFNPLGISDPDPCTGGLAPDDEDKTFKAGQLNLDPGQFQVIKTRKLSMQEDGNLVYYKYVVDKGKGKEDGPLYATGTSGRVNGRLVFQPDGNLVIYGLRDQVFFATGTNGHREAVLEMQKEGNLVMLVREGGRVLWSPFDINFKAGEFELRAGEFVAMPGRKLSMQGDGNLVLYKTNERGSEGQPLFASNTGGIGGGARVAFQSDGNLVVYDRNNNARYATGTNGSAGGGTLRMQRDGNLVIYNSGGNPVFATNSSGR